MTSIWRHSWKGIKWKLREITSRANVDDCITLVVVRSQAFSRWRQTVFCGYGANRKQHNRHTFSARHGPRAKSPSPAPSERANRRRKAEKPTFHPPGDWPPGRTLSTEKLVTNGVVYTGLIVLFWLGYRTSADDTLNFYSQLFSVLIAIWWPTRVLDRLSHKSWWLSIIP